MLEERFSDLALDALDVLVLAVVGSFVSVVDAGSLGVAAADDAGGGDGLEAGGRGGGGPD